MIPAQFSCLKCLSALIFKTYAIVKTETDNSVFYYLWTHTKKITLFKILAIE